MESNNHTGEARWFAHIRGFAGVSLTSKVLIAIIVIAMVADIAWEFDRPDQKTQLIHRAALAAIAVWLLCREKKA
jgi:hypothetical protein